jgi:hypothetical protein
MRIVAPVLAVALSLSVLPARADEGQPPPQPRKELTVVRGTPPADLVGRWMAVIWIELPGGKSRTTAVFWEIAKDAGQLALTNRFAELPAAQTAALNGANQTEQPWRPTPEEVATVAREWDALKPDDPRIAQIQNEIVARDGFDESFKGEPRTKDAVWVIRQAEDFDSTAAPAVKQINVYGALGPKDDGWAGNYTGATLAAAPFPIPITLNGTFQAYRLSGGPAAPRGFLARLLDLFSGCGRR